MLGFFYLICVLRDGFFRRTACKVDSTGRGRVVIWIVLPTMLEMTNMDIPT